MNHRFSYRFLGWSACLLVGIAGASAASQDAKSASKTGASPAQHETIRQQENARKAEAFMAEGKKALSFKDYETAYVKYLDAVELFSQTGGKSDPRKAAVAQFSDVAIQYAESLIKRGRYSEAQQVAKTVLLPQFNPSYKPAVKLLANLEQPDVYNKTVTPQFAAKQDQVNKLFQEAEGFYAAGRFDLATKRYNQIIEIDPYNKAAREGMERTDSERMKYYTTAYNETRSRLLWEVTKAWETPVPLSIRKDTSNTGLEKVTRGTEAIQNKLNRIIIPKINLQDASLKEAVAFLQQQSIRLDTSLDDAKKGVNIIVQADPTQTGAADPAAEMKVSLALNNVPLYEALRYIADMSGMRVKLDTYAVSLVPLSVPVDTLVNKEYRVPPGFIPLAPTEDSSSGFAPRGEIKRENTSIKGRADAKKFLEDNGITFPAGASAQYVSMGSKLLVRNTLDNIELIDNIVNATVGVAPTQVEIETKFLEVSQNNLAELGFDWMLGPLRIPDSGMYIGGGDLAVPGVYPFPTDGMNFMTQGLRSGSGPGETNALTANSLDALLGGADLGLAPGIFGLSGIFNNAQFQVLIRALDQKKGVDLLSAPKVTTKSGQSAKIEIVRNLIYPTAFQPPTVSEGAEVTINGSPDPRRFPPPQVAPSFPNSFGSEKIGVILEVEPVVGTDSYTIDLALNPRVIDFDGFINYGSPINGVSYQEVNPVYVRPEAFAITENIINQPIFSVRSVQTNVTIWDGQTVGLGGLMREDVQKVEDKVPILGDIPLAGRLFRSNVDQKIKKNLIIFVTANLIDAEGRPLRRTNEEEDGPVDQLGLPPSLPQPQFPSYKGGGMSQK